MYNYPQQIKSEDIEEILAIIDESQIDGMTLSLFIKIEFFLILITKNSIYNLSENTYFSFNLKV